MIDSIELSKAMSHALRHNPEEYGFTLDINGWVHLDVLTNALRKKSNVLCELSQEDIRLVVEESVKKRHEIKGDMIRAIYGHSIEAEIEYAPMEPPSELYHGTTEKAVGSILKDGLKSMDRQYVHMSSDIDNALYVGKRRSSKPVILRVYAQLAFTNGIEFYLAEGNIWVSKFVPSAYIKIFI